MVRKFFCKTIHLAPWGNGDKSVRDTIAPATAVAHSGRVQSVLKFSNFF
jgi:hypothetical protein